MGRVDGKVAIVTGGAGGIGGATARALAARRRVGGRGRHRRRRGGAGGQAIQASGGTAVGLGADLAEEADVISSVEAAVARFGRLDVVHNNAALTDSDFLSRDTRVTELTVEVWERTMAVNLRSQMLMCKHAIPEMVRHGGGSIINMSSGASAQRRPDPYRLRGLQGGCQHADHVRGHRARQAGRAGQHDRSRAHHHRRRPGPSHRSHPGLPRAGHAHPLPGQPDDIANLVVFLASEESRYITGQMIAIDGGMSVHVGQMGRDDD